MAECCDSPTCPSPRPERSCGAWSFGWSPVSTLLLPGPALCHGVTRAVHHPDLALCHSGVKVVQAHPPAPWEGFHRTPLWPGHWPPRAAPTQPPAPSPSLSLSALLSPVLTLSLDPTDVSFSVAAPFLSPPSPRICPLTQGLQHLHSPSLPWNK